MNFRGFVAFGAAASVLAAVAGCSSDPGKAAAPADVQGTAKFSDGKPVADVVVNLLPQFAGAGTGSAPTGADGGFTAKVAPGKYAFTFEGKPGKPDGIKAVPAKYKSADAANVVDITGTGPVEITVQK